MKNFKKVVFGLLAMLVMVTSVSAAKVNYTTLTKLVSEDGKVEVSSADGEVKTYTLDANLGDEAIEIDKSGIVLDLNGNALTNVKVSADNVSFKDSGRTGSIANLELTAKMTVVVDEVNILMSTVVTNKGTLTVEKNAFLGDVVNSGTLTVSGTVNKISVSAGTVSITDDAVLGGGQISLWNEVTGGNVTIAENATIPAGYFKVAGGSVISYSHSNCMAGKTNDDIHIKGEDKDGNFFHTIVPISELKFDVKILDSEEEEVSGNLTKGEIYTVTVVEYWNGLEVHDNVGMETDLLRKSFKVTSGDVLVKYDDEDAEDNQYIAIADGEATFEISIENLNYSDSSEHLLKVEADSNHSTMKPAEQQPAPDPVEDPTDDGDQAGDETEGKVPSTFDGIASIVTMAISSVSAAGYSIKKIIRK